MNNNYKFQIFKSNKNNNVYFKLRKNESQTLLMSAAIESYDSAMKILDYLKNNHNKLTFELKFEKKSSRQLHYFNVISHLGFTICESQKYHKKEKILDIINNFSDIVNNSKIINYIPFQ